MSQTWIQVKYITVHLNDSKLYSNFTLHLEGFEHKYYLNSLLKYH